MKTKLLISIIIFSVIIYSCKKKDVKASIPTDYKIALSLNGKDANIQNNGAVLAVDRKRQSGEAMSFDGKSYIEFPVTTLQLPQYTYSLWVNTDALPQAGLYSCILGIGSLGGDQAVTLNNNTGIYKASGFYMYAYDKAPYLRQGTIASKEFKSVVPEIGRWYHLVYVRDKEKYKLYIDNLKIFEGTTSSDEAFYGNYTVKAYVGTRPDDERSAFKGKVDDVRIYGRTLTEQEIATLYQE